MFKYVLLLSILYAIFQLTHANYISLPFTSASEGREADTTTDITRNGRVLAPYPNSMRIPSKPPLLHWVAAGISKLFGTESEWAFRLANVTGCFIFALTVFLIASQFVANSQALISSVLAFSIVPFWKYSCAFRVDMWLTTCIYLAIWQFLKMLKVGSFSSKEWALFWFFMLLTIFAKGPVGLAFVLPPIFILLYMTGSLKNAGLSRCIFPACATVAVITAWMFYCSGAYGSGYWEKIGGELTMRFTDDPLIASSEAAKPIHYGLLQAFVDLMPMTFFVIPAIIYVIRNRRTVPAGILLLAILFVWVLLVVTLVPKKRDVYNLPAYGAGLVVCTYYLINRFSESNTLQKCAVAVGALVILGCAYAIMALAPSETTIRRVHVEINPSELKPFLSIGMVAGLLIMAAGMLKNVHALLWSSVILLACVGAASDLQLPRTLIPGGKTDLAKRGLRGPHEYTEEFRTKLSGRTLYFCELYDSLVYYYSGRKIVPNVSRNDLARMKNAAVICDAGVEVPASYKLEFEFLNQIGRPIRLWTSP